MVIIGHHQQWQLLKKMAEADRIPHGLLFHGQPGLGKKTVALEFVKLLNCQAKNFEQRPCQACRFCQDIQKRQHPDLTLITPVKKEIEISQIRALSSYLSLSTYSGLYKIAIIDQAHCMNQEAQSAFLKTLEEPKGKTILILITEYPDQLLPTILSRVEKIKFYPVPNQDIRNYLEKKGISQVRAQALAEVSFGRPGIALNFLKDPQKLESQQKMIKEIIRLCGADLSSRFQYAKEIAKTSPQNLKEILDIWLRYFRNALLSTLVPHQDVVGDQRYSLFKLKKIISAIQTINFLILNTNVNPRLALEILILEL